MPTQIYPPRAVVRQEVVGTSIPMELPSQPVILVGPNNQVVYRKLGDEEYTGTSMTLSYPGLVAGSSVNTGTVGVWAYFADTNGVYRVYDVLGSVTPLAGGITVPSSLNVEWAVEDGVSGRISSINYAPTAGKYYQLYDGTASGSVIVVTGDVESEFKTGSTIFNPFIYVTTGSYTGFLKITDVSVSGDTTLTVEWGSGFAGFATGEPVEFYPVQYSTLREADVDFGNVTYDDRLNLEEGYYAGNYTVLGKGVDTSVFIYFAGAVYQSAQMSISGQTITVTNAGFDNIVKVGDRLWVIDATGANTSSFRVIKVTPETITVDGSISSVSNAHFLVGRYLQTSTALSYAVYHTAAIGSAELPSSRFLVSYRALRTDGANVLYEASSIQDAYDDLGLAIPENPLGLAVNIAISSTGGYPVYYMKIASDDANGYNDAITTLEGLSGPYYLVPLTHSPTVHAAVKQHVDVMSNDDNQVERIALINRVLYVYDARESGTTNGTFDSSTVFRVAGTDITGSVSMGNILYISYNDAEGYQQTASLTIQGAVFTGGNTDITLTGPFAGWEAFTGSSRVWEVRTAALSKTGQAGYIADYGRSFKHKRVTLVWPDYVKYNYTVNEAGDDPYHDTSTVYEGAELGGYYAAAEVAALASSRSDPSRPMNKVQLSSFSGALHANGYFTPYQLNVMAAGGVMILVSETDEGPLQIRDQLTTDTSVEETIQFSSVTALDYGAKMLRSVLTKLTGVYKQDEDFFSKLNMYINGVVEQLVNSKIWKNARILTIKPVGSTVYVTIAVTLYDVAKTIDITLKV